jgi:hypothetical protein
MHKILRLEDLMGKTGMFGNNTEINCMETRCEGVNCIHVV